MFFNCFLSYIKFYFFKEVIFLAKCYFCEKALKFGIKISHSHRRSNRTFKPNIRRVKATIKGVPMHIKVCTRCLRSGKVAQA